MTENQHPDRSRRLGRGLSALIGSPQTTAASAPAPEPFREIRLDLIEPNPLQPRRDFPDDEIRELQASMQASGLIQPVTVRARPDGRFELIAGERRFRAARRLGWSSIAAFVRQVSDEQMLSLALVENLQREDLNPIEEALGYRQLIADFGLAHHQVAEAVGKDRSTITNAIRLLSLPDEVQRMVREGALSLGHARALLGAPSADAMIDLARRVVTQRLSVRDVERLVQRSRPAGRRPRTPTAASVPGIGSPEVRRLTDRLRRFLQTDVAVQVDSGSGGRGELRIRFYSADDFNRIFELITRTPTAAD
ncbi:MAG: ParB/RepB/Spo0J family partition protein [Gemmatimonadaceae bacterium]|nr:ParB/RepB/Spo0J family partition protein [Gemmatimonadaceae bacterium]